jgi:hypothetical protein
MTAWLPKRLSVSAVECYARCPAAYERRYVHGVVDPPSPAMAFGRCMATALEALHRGQDGDVAWLRAYALAQAAGEMRGAPSIQHGLALLGAYQAHGVVQGEPEWRWELYLPDRDAVPVPLVGFLDVATPTEVVEFKTSAAVWDQARVDGSAQAAVYHWAYTRLKGRKPRQVRFIILHTRRVELRELVTYPTGDGLRLFQFQAAAVWRGVRAGQFAPKCLRWDCLACIEAGVAKPKPERDRSLDLRL